MKILMSHPTGNANVRAASIGFMEANMLAEFHTTIASFPSSLLDNLGAIRSLSEIRRRRYDPILRHVTRTYPWREIGRLAASKMNFTKLIKHETGAFCIDAVYQSIDRKVASRLKHGYIKDVNAVYSYEDGALNSFYEAKRIGINCFYDLPTGHWRAARRLLEIEKERWPDWASTITGFKDSAEKLERKDKELYLADCIFVASQFSAKTLEEFPGKLAPIHVIPYGFPPVLFKREFLSPKARALRLLFVGKLTQQKGIANLLNSVEVFGKHVELTIVGRKINNDCAVLNSALSKHRWFPSLSHEGILQLMREHDVLVFPSLFDGFGLVITEAMSQGTPVITTERSAGPDLIVDGNNGWLVEAGSKQALQTAIENLLLHPELISYAGSNAMETARCRPWEKYQQELADAIREMNIIGI